MIDGAPEELKKKELLELALNNNVPLGLQKSLGITVPEVVKALRRFEVVSGITLSKVGTGQMLKERVKQLEEEVKHLQAEKSNLSNSNSDMSFGEFDSLENEIGALSFDSIDFTEDLSLTDDTLDVNIDSPRVAQSLLQKKPISKLSNSTGDVRAVSTSPARKGSLPITNINKLLQQLELATEESKKLQKELEIVRNENKNLKEEIKTNKKSQGEKNTNKNSSNSSDDKLNDNHSQLLKQNEDLRMQNKDYKSKMNSLTETVQQLIKESAVLCCEHCKKDPGMIFRIDEKNRIRNSTVVTPFNSSMPLQKIASSPRLNLSSVTKTLPNDDEKTKNSNKEDDEKACTELESKRDELQSSVDELQQLKYSVEMDKYQLSLDVDRLKNEYNAAKEKKKKLFQVVQNLSTKRETLLKDCEDAKRLSVSIKEEIEMYKIEKDGQQSTDNADSDNLIDSTDSDIEPDDISSASNSDLKTQLRRMQTIVSSLTKQKRELEMKLSQLS